MENIVKIIDLLLKKNQLNTDGVLGTPIFPIEFISTGIEAKEILEILKKLENLKYIKIYSHGTGQWPVYIINHKDNQKLFFSVNEVLLLNYRNDLLNNYVNNGTNRNEDKIKISISRDYGIYKNGDKSTNYPIRGQRALIIRYLGHGGGQAIKLATLEESLRRNESLIKKEINLVNNLFKKSLI